MQRLVTLVAVFILIIAVGCNKKAHPTTSAETPTSTTSTTETKKVVKKNVAVPKVIVVNDKAAKRSLDGRYYYDLNGRRYWRNNKDGKYYLFNKSMFNDDAFKSPDNN